MQIRRWYYSDDIAAFLGKADQQIIGELSESSLNIERSQITAWMEQLDVLKSALRSLAVGGRIYLEYVIPRLGKRVDCLLVINHVVLILEFKVGERVFTGAALEQVWDYALDLRNFHETSHSVPIAPLLVLPDAQPVAIDVHDEAVTQDPLIYPVRVGFGQLAEGIRACLSALDGKPISITEWESGRYLPTPTIVEAARALYAGHKVDAISRSDGGRINLARTSKAIDLVIEESRRNGVKSICLVSGVPGAGKTLVGLDVANRHRDKDNELHSVFLSGNGPLVAVLREALALDSVKRSLVDGKRISKGEARRQVSSFIQNVHHFRDDCIKDDARPPAEHVALFDEAQRAWNLAKTQKFMQSKKGIKSFELSEPEFLISCLNRHSDWATIVCLIGSGQEINEGEAGVAGWIDAIKERYPDWELHLSPSLHDAQYGVSETLARMEEGFRVKWNPDLHLSSSVRSFRAEHLSDFVRLTLDLDAISARQVYRSFQEKYPIVLTRDVETAKKWLRQQARGSERFGLVVSSQAQRLKPLAIDVRVSNKVDPVHWFLHPKEDTRSSYYLEDAATEFQVQGLELDWAAIVWDGDLRFSSAGWRHHKFVGDRWVSVKAPDRKRYLENAYRVLLTRARQGMVLVVPRGNPDDPTRSAGHYDPTFNYLRSLGLREI